MTQTTRRSTVVGVFQERDDARRAIEALKDAGFAPDSISILSPDKQATQTMAEETGTHAGSGAATGAVTGGILGGLGGWLIGIGALAIPGVGPFIAAGAFATALTGAAIGAGVGAIAGALIGMGVPKEEAEYYEGEVKSGRTLVTVKADTRYDEAQRILRQNGAYDVENRTAGSAATTGAVAGQAVAASSTGRTAQGEQTMQLREEELQARKTPVETGQVTLGKDVVEEERTLDVPVTREEVYVERRAVDRPADRPIETGAQQTIDVPVREERVDLEKRAVVYEEVGVNKQQVVENQQVSDTVRREELRLDKEGDVNIPGARAGATTTWDQAMPTYRQEWQQRYGSAGGRWEDYEPAYRYGYELRNRPEYRGRAWTEVEPELQRDWTQRNPTTPWARVSNSVRDTWQNVTS
ncbi:MAG: YsnF/AvaK domain-containing protein [Chloroflexi bacterium]|nr:YsnF/AvaK domain-containing protein [Chloroflexota bacterium]